MQKGGVDSDGTAFISLVRSLPPKREERNHCNSYTTRGLLHETDVGAAVVVKINTNNSHENVDNTNIHCGEQEKCTHF